MSDTQITVVDRPDSSRRNDYYTSNRQPLVSSALIRLPVRSTRPAGWLRETLERQLDGMTGRLTEISAWLAKEGNAWLDSRGLGTSGWEEVPYWLRGYISLAYLLEDEHAIDESRIWIEGILRSQQPNGDFGPSASSRRQNVRWGVMLALYCLRSHYAATGDDRVITLMTGYFDFLSASQERILNHYWDHMRGGDLIDSVIWLYNITGKTPLLDLVERVHRDTARWDDGTTLPSLHNVNVAQGFREPATYYLANGDPKYLDASYCAFAGVRREYGQVPGGMFGGDENCREGHADPHQAVETCGMVEQMYADERMLEISGDPIWADHCEDVAFNSFPAAFMPDYRSLRYLTAPNHVLSDRHNHSPGVDNPGAMFLMNPLSHRCCQHNHTFGWPYFVETLFMATPDNGLAATLLGPGAVEAHVGSGASVSLSSETRYPFGDEIHYRFEGIESGVRFPFYVRIPQWCEAPMLSVTGDHFEPVAAAGRFIRIERSWKSGDSLTVRFPMQVRLRKWPAQNDAVSVDRGPLTYSLRIPTTAERLSSTEHALNDSRWQSGVREEEWPSWELHPSGPWNYALESDVDGPDAGYSVVARDWPEDNYPFTPDASPVRLVARGHRVEGWSLDDHGLCGTVPASPVAADGGAEEIELIPMGAARLRLTVFPRVADASPPSAGTDRAGGE